MKKIILSTSLLIASLFSSEQSHAQEIAYGIKGGYSLARVRAPKTADITDHSAISTFNVQAYTDIGFTEGFSLQVGLAVNGKGSNILVGSKDNATWSEYKSSPIYLELPVNAIAKIQIGDIFDKCNIILGGGPYIALGIAGKSNVTGQTLGVSYSADDNISYTNDDAPLNTSNYYGKFKNVDFGLNALAGIEYHWVTFNVNYGYGLINVNPGANLTAIDRIKNRVWSASIGVKF